MASGIQRLEQMDAGRRLWGRDGTLWSNDPGVRGAIEKRLGWLTSPMDMVGRLGEITDFAESVRRDGVRDVVLLGMGGSSLAAETLARTFLPPPGAPALTVLDTTDPGAIRAAAARLKLRETLFLVASKSGTTTETLALYRYFREQVERETSTAGAHFAAITDAGTPLERLATEAGFRKTFLNAPDIGGRFSALSSFGLVPAALVGVDVAGLLDRARAMAAACGPDVPVAENPGLRLGAALAGWAQAGRDKVTLLITPSTVDGHGRQGSGVGSLGVWLEQLLTESTGKQGRGLVAIVDEPPGPPAVYGADRLFVALGLGHDVALERAVAPLEAAGHPVVRLDLGDPLDIGAEFFRWEVATAAAGVLLDLNPFDEPNVAQAKDATQAALATYKERGRLPEWPVDGVDETARVLVQARPGDYIALLAYVTPTPETTEALQSLRVALRDRTRLATTLGYGPRYLHSTGQLHKGGPPTPILLMLTAEAAGDVAIPGERYGFATLELAQALGDLATLRAARRRVLRVPLGGDPRGGIARLTTELTRRLG
ncbi:MAG: glucose-6-phosphate isomerase [Candidatus Rokubacteria bacterium]|nr:glucose-6-phosphate isomerase [Candidatus Rokubacteria bacterium]